MSSTRPSQARWAAADDGWGPSTAFYAGGSRGQAGSHAPADAAFGQRLDPRAAAAADDNWSPAGPASRAQQRANRAIEDSLRDLHRRTAPERGLPWWLALLVLLVIAGLGGGVDALSSSVNRGGFNIGIVVASVVAILLVRRSGMFPIVVAPPIVYTVAAVAMLYVRSSGLSNKRVVFDSAANYLVYGFPAIAASTAIVLIVAGIRLIVRR